MSTQPLHYHRIHKPTVEKDPLHIDQTCRSQINDVQV